MSNTPPATSVRRDEAELHALAEEGAARFTDVTTDWQAAVRWAGETFGDRIAVACSMAADTVLVDLVAKEHPGVDVLFLDTGYHFPETLGTRAELGTTLPVHVVDVKARRSVDEQDAEFGPKLHERDPGLCCQMRKVEPLNTSLEGYDAWVTGVRREDNALRANAQLVEWDASHGMVKINPVAGWSFDQVIDYATAHDVPVNSLLADGYPSIGCAPCTRRVAPGEDPRAGRWAGLGKTECGIHL